MYTVGIICAVERELEPFLKEIGHDKTTFAAMLTFHEGDIDGAKVVALYCGVCKVNAAIATQILIDRFKVNAVVVSGTAGGLDERLQIGDSVIATEVCYHDVAGGILTGNTIHGCPMHFLSQTGSCWHSAAKRSRCKTMRKFIMGG